MKNLYGKAFKLINILLSAFIVNGLDSCTTPQSKSGFCVPYKKCPIVSQLLQYYGSSAMIPSFHKNFILQSKCSKNNDPEIRLCCEFPKDFVEENSPSADDRSGKSDSTISGDLDYMDIKSQLNSKGLSILNDLECGNADKDRVAGGEKAGLRELPWMALLRCDLDDGYHCGGSLITSRYVLTAAHCIHLGIYKLNGVRLGEYDLTSNPDCKPVGKKQKCNPVVEDFGIEKVIIHPKYVDKSHHYDIALIKLERDVEFKTHIKPLCLPITKASLTDNSNAFLIAGWGATEHTGGTRSDVLMKASVVGLPRSTCYDYFKSSISELNDRHICAGDLENGKDSCRGDSGGPLISLNLYNDETRFIQYGIVASGGVSCNTTQLLPTIYTNVLAFLPWITDNIID